MPIQSPNRSIEIKRWAKRMRAWKENKAALLQLLVDRGYTRELVAEWMQTPSPKLQGRTPRDLMNPRSIGVLYQYAKKHLAMHTKA